MEIKHILSVLIVIISITSSIQTACNNEHSTLCELKNGTKACCPVEDATCCSTGDYCCPKNFRCDIDNGRCVKESLYIPFHLKLNKVSNVVCPDKTSECPSGTTCCQLENGKYGCCPVPNAVCCQDHVHCCPSGYTCDTKDGRCNKGNLSVDIFKKFQSNKISNVVCPDKTSECPSETTCCQLENGKYGCCPVPNAVCCQDHVHCCPSGYTCDTKDGRCNKGDVSLPFYTKIKSIEKNLDNVVCPDGLATCPSDSTCCKMGSGEYACCPLPEATCCSDQLHCCPNGYKCDIAEGKCNKGDMSIPFHTKVEAKMLNKKVDPDDLICPNSNQICAPGSTCCMLINGLWGCCPLRNAVCCADDLHCCPEGFKCDIEKHNCVNELISIPFYKKEQAKVRKEIVKKPTLESVVCPDGCSFCPKDNTCCKMFDGSYGCCPLANAVCCEDELHCCPENSKCNVEKGSCEGNQTNMTWFDKTKAQKNYLASKELTVKLGPLICPDNTSCDVRNTCCRYDEKSFGCCPYSNGVCCENSSFCCPENTVCGKEPGQCLKKMNHVDKNIQITNWHLIEKKAGDLFKEIKERGILNDCPLKDRCNKADGSYLCCPYNNGTCCGSHGYCCPGGGYICDDPKLESCRLPEEKTESIKKFDKKDEIGSLNDCPLKDRCNKADGSYLCCPYNNGTCCGSHGYCCPGGGYICDDPKLESCRLPEEKENIIQPVKIKEQVLFKKSLRHRFTFFSQPKSVECEDSIHFCPDTYSCCVRKNPDNNKKFGCCPVENAVCCDDGINCCPKGYECTNNSLTTCRKKKD